jgi:hypothetical protein
VCEREDTSTGQWSGERTGVSISAGASSCSGSPCAHGTYGIPGESGRKDDALVQVTHVVTDAKAQLMGCHNVGPKLVYGCEGNVAIIRVA